MCIDCVNALLHGINGTKWENISGELWFTNIDDKSIQVSGFIYNYSFILLNGGLHGFHIHNGRPTDNNCSTLGGHFNPNSVRSKEIITIFN